MWTTFFPPYIEIWDHLRFSVGGHLDYDTLFTKRVGPYQVGVVHMEKKNSRADSIPSEVLEGDKGARSIALERDWLQARGAVAGMITFFFSFFSFDCYSGPTPFPPDSPAT